MKHTSVLKLNSPIEFIESSKISPFVSKVQIKVCYVGDEPNRNHSIITKEVAKEIAPSLRGCPIVGFYNEIEGDFEEHNQQITISNGQWKITDSTVPYGFIDLNAKIWFATYIDDENKEREYLCTEGYIWDDAYPEAKRILEQGNNHSLEFDEKTLNASWTRDINGKPEFFIINEAFFSKLCILGENMEPCFEGSQITKFSLVIDDSFKQKMYSMMNEIKDLLTEGGTKVFTTKYAVEIGDTLWSTLYDYILQKYPADDVPYTSRYRIDGIFEKDNQKFVVLKDCVESKYYRLNFSLSEENGLEAEDTLIEVTKDYIPVAGTQFSADGVENFVTEYIQKKKDEEDKDKKDEEEDNDSEDSSEDENDEEDKKVKKYSFDSLEEIPEYLALQTKFSELETQVATLNSTIEQLNNEITPLRKFKATAEKKEKEEMISKFYMLSEEDKKDVIDNIDKYSLSDIEAKLSIICVRNKVNFDDGENNTQQPITYHLNDSEDNSSATPAWVKAVLETAKKLN